LFGAFFCGQINIIVANGWPLFFLNGDENDGPMGYQTAAPMGLGA
jgi:hypothetical protein